MELETAVKFCLREEKGSKAYMSKFYVKKFSQSPLDRRLQVAKEKGGVYDKNWFLDKRRLLTWDEEIQLAKFIVESGKKDNGQSRLNIESKIIEILTLKRSQNKKKGRLLVPLSEPARKLLLSRSVSRGFFVDFYSRHKELKRTCSS